MAEVGFVLFGTTVKISTELSILKRAIGRNKHVKENRKRTFRRRNFLIEFFTMGKFSELRNFRNGMILEVNREQRPNLSEIEKRFLVAGMKNEESVCQINDPGDNEHDPVYEHENETSKDVDDIGEENKVKKYKTIKKKLTEVFALLQRPKRKPLREFFIDEEEELESKYPTYS